MSISASARLFRALSTSSHHRPAVVTAMVAATATGVALLAPVAPTAASGAAAGAASEAAAAATSSAPRLPGGVALTWSPAYMSSSHDFSATEARALAQANDMVVSMPVAFGRHATTMRSTNADITLLAYANATLAGSSDVTGLGEQAFAHDSSGRRITATGWGTRLMESSNGAWRARASSQCVDRSRRGNFDGCLLDMLTLGIFSRGFVSGLPVNPATGRVYTQREYQAQMVSLGASIRRASPSLVFSGNVVENDYRYWRNTEAKSRTAALQMPSVQMEDFLRGAGNGVSDFPAEAAWVRNVDVIRDLESHGVVGLFTTKLWTGASTAQAAGWQAYSMASFLMGANGRSFFSFTRSRDRAGVLGTNLPYRMPKGIGSPAGAMERRSSGAYVRRFARGVAVVNPTGRSVTVPIGSSMRRLNGAWTSSLTLPPNSGDVLTTTARTSGPTRDTKAPTAGFRGRNRTVGKLRLYGKAKDNVAVKTVKVAVRNEATGRWRRADGSWGRHRTHAVALRSPGRRTTGWSRAFGVRPGRYGVSLVAIDKAGNRQRRKPWRVYRVR